MIERHHLTIVSAIVEEGSLTKAANSLCLTQSALSHSIKKLEHILGDKLWTIQGRRIELTESGNKVLALANRVIPQFEHTEQEIKNIANGLQGKLRIGMECYPCFQWLLKVIAPYLKRYPDVDVDINKEFQFGGIGALLSFDIDVLITPDPIYIKTINYLPIFEYELALVASEQHELTSKTFVTPQDLANETVFTHPIELSRLDIFSQFITPAGISLKKHKTIEDIEMMMQLVSANRGVTAIPLWLAQEYQQRLPIRTIKLTEDGIKKCVYIGLRATEKPPHFINEFITLAKNIASEEY